MNEKQLADALFPRPKVKPAFNVGKSGSSGVTMGGDTYTHPLNATPTPFPAGSDVVCFEVDGQQVVIGGGAFHTF